MNLRYAVSVRGSNLRFALAIFGVADVRTPRLAHGRGACGRRRELPTRPSRVCAPRQVPNTGCSRHGSNSSVGCACCFALLNIESPNGDLLRLVFAMIRSFFDPFPEHATSVPERVVATGRARFPGPAIGGNGARNARDGCRARFEFRGGFLQKLAAFAGFLGGDIVRSRQTAPHCNASSIGRRMIGKWPTTASGCEPPRVRSVAGQLARRVYQPGSLA